MIGQLKGKIVFNSEKYVILDVSGVGYKVSVTFDTINHFIKNSSGEITLWTYLAVRENSLDLYGFLDKTGLEFFELIIGVSGIGPKTALNIMSLATVETLREAIMTGDATYLTKVSGIGKRNAEKIVLELKDKIGKLVNVKGEETLKEEIEVIEALQALGYSSRDAREAIKKVSKETTGTSNIIKEVLKELGK